MIAEKSVYGTRDAPRGFWKELHNTVVACGMKPLPLETAAYYLPGPHGTVQGLLGTHVDDLLSCGTSAMDAVMAKVKEKFKFGTSEEDTFKYCGRIVSQEADGIRITSPSVLDRTKPIFINGERRNKRSEAATPSEISQLRSVVGSISWLARTCRPDLSFAVNQLQAVQQSAKVQHLIEANRLLNHALQGKDRGIFFPRRAFKFEDAVVVSVTDASHAASVESNGQKIMGHRSQTGRILALADPSFLETGEGKIHMLEWHSNTIRRVCRSTLQAETLSLLAGTEEAEHLRQLLFVVKNLAESGEKPCDYMVRAMDHTKVLWYTDCRSLSDYLTNPARSGVSDKRLAIDLTSLR